MKKTLKKCFILATMIKSFSYENINVNDNVPYNKRLQATEIEVFKKVFKVLHFLRKNQLFTSAI